ncbi:MAG: hypothetical protein LHV69_05665 [Elusimicrobia bacterium]|nr:hypothetical protein [Candidatus Obscuribacterium magneticum]
MVCRSLINRTFTAFLCAIFFATNCAFAHAPESNFWAERRKALKAANQANTVIPAKAGIQGPVIPAKAGIHSGVHVVDSRFRGNDGRLPETQLAALTPLHLLDPTATSTGPPKKA